MPRTQAHPAALAIDKLLRSDEFKAALAKMDRKSRESLLKYLREVHTAHLQAEVAAAAAHAASGQELSEEQFALLEAYSPEVLPQSLLASAAAGTQTGAGAGGGGEEGFVDTMHPAPFGFKHRRTQANMFLELGLAPTASLRGGVTDSDSDSGAGGARRTTARQVRAPPGVQVAASWSHHWLYVLNGLMCTWAR